MNDQLDCLLERSAALHRHLCPRQVLGVRMGLYAGRTLGLDVPQPFESKRVLTIAEIDGCFADGVSTATNCWVGRRTLRIQDFGKVAATFIDTLTEQAIRIRPRHSIRQAAIEAVPGAANRWSAQLIGYQRLEDTELFDVQPVVLGVSLASLISRAGYRVVCQHCGEEILNERERVVDGRVLCRACAPPSEPDARIALPEWVVRAVDR